MFWIKRAQQSSNNEQQGILLSQVRVQGEYPIYFPVYHPYTLSGAPVRENGWSREARPTQNHRKRSSVLERIRGSVACQGVLGWLTNELRGRRCGRDSRRNIHVDYEKDITLIELKPVQVIRRRCDDNIERRDEEGKVAPGYCGGTISRPRRSGELSREANNTSIPTRIVCLTNWKRTNPAHWTHTRKNSDRREERQSWCKSLNFIASIDSCICGCLVLKLIL